MTSVQWSSSSEDEDDRKIQARVSYSQSPTGSSTCNSSTSLARSLQSDTEDNDTSVSDDSVQVLFVKKEPPASKEGKKKSRKATSSKAPSLRSAKFDNAFKKALQFYQNNNNSFGPLKSTDSEYQWLYRMKAQLAQYDHFIHNGGMRKEFDVNKAGSQGLTS